VNNGQILFVKLEELMIYTRNSLYSNNDYPLLLIITRLLPWDYIQKVEKQSRFYQAGNSSLLLPTTESDTMDSIEVLNNEGAEGAVECFSINLGSGLSMGLTRSSI